MTLSLKPPETKRVAAIKWIVRSILLAVLFVGKDFVHAHQGRHPVDPLQVTLSLGLAVAMPWMAKKPITLHILLVLVWMGIAVLTYAVVHVLGPVLHIPHSASGWLAVATLALTLAPSAAVADRWQRRIDQQDARRAGVVTKYRIENKS